VAHVSAAVGNKHGCGRDSGELVDEELIARFSETAGLSSQLQPPGTGERQHQD